jgi:RNA polymerase sigma factor for flagellar operon FliA
MDRALLRLRERERQIITLYYREELTMKQIAERLKVDESRISQLHSAAVVRLKAAVESHLQSRHAATSGTALSKAAGA